MFTVYHEPENDMTADQWWAMFSPVYDTMKNARPGLSVVFCAMTYHDGPGGAALGKFDTWCRDAPCDASAPTATARTRLRQDLQRLARH